MCLYTKHLFDNNNNNSKKVGNNNNYPPNIDPESS